MDGKRIVGGIIGGALLSGNCIASEEATMVQDEFALRETLQHLIAHYEELLQSMQQGRGVFTSVDEVRTYMKRREIDPKELKMRLEVTWTYWRDGNIPHVENIPSDEWRRSKVVEIFSEVRKMAALQEDFEDVVEMCDMKIGAISEGGNEFVKAKLLLISQCQVWDESENKFKLWIDKDKEIVRRAFGMLRSMAQRQDENGEKARALLGSMKSVKD